MDGRDQPQAIHSPGLPLDQAQGRTVISDNAVAKVVGVAARGVAGVHALGSGASRSIGAIRDVVGATDLTQGVRVEVGESQVAVDLVLVAIYGYPLQQLADAVRAAVYGAVEGLVGRDVIEVNIEITDVFIPSAEPERQQPRTKLSERLGAPVRPAAPNPSAAPVGHEKGQP
ncbi:MULTISPECIES: Asp23/Gls24 family envelope stress response protein [unclassified Arthrobacter]|uniref:Asp23/Gls24 family envelope stress response protein n=1 Tax=unclassified Arthrobacter TaxID=235627 RepID=UPI00159D3C7F|nr:MULTISPECIES: Asp23/Gls24 family envelope stress response protein [unclassified Arthrobacter]MCQ9162640.1 Asp23/Gls24 family envelope stress response protein [Arthrobacter sp. STN4]NVM97377.1 Asp23/Gls24 family envelope stress response protein [Arthrobacter sp. SDTb3-6]